MADAARAFEREDIHPTIRAVIEIFEAHSFSYLEDGSNPHYVVVYAVRSDGAKTRIGVKSEIIGHFTAEELRNALPHFLR